MALEDKLNELTDRLTDLEDLNLSDLVKRVERIESVLGRVLPRTKTPAAPLPAALAPKSALPPGSLATQTKRLGDK